MTDRTFFEKQTLSSRVKASIVSELLLSGKPFPHIKVKG